MSSSKHRRKSYLINTKLQLRYAIYIFATLAIISFVSSLSLSLGIWNVVVKEFSKESLKHRLAMASQIHDYEVARQGASAEGETRLSQFKDVELLSIREKEILQEVLKQNNKELAYKILPLFIFIALGTIFLTHKIAGPLFRLQQTFQKIRDGNLHLRIQLRKSDHGHDILPDLNAMIGSLDYSFAKIKALSKKLIDTFESQGIANNATNQYKRELERELNRYKTSDAYKII